MVLARDEALERRIAQVAWVAYGHVPAVEKYHSENNYVCRLRFGGATPDRVIKVGRHLAPAVAQEAEALRRLRAAGLEVPEVELTGEGVPGCGLTFVVMPHLGEMDLCFACSQGLEWAEAACTRTGEFVARLQTLPLEVLSGFTPQHYRDLRTVYRGSRWERVREMVFEEADRDFVEDVGARVEVDRGGPELVVTHESLIPAQVLTDGGGAFAVTDWETIRAGRPMQDVSCFGAGLLAWCGRGERYWEAFVDGLTGGGDLSDEQRDAVRAWEAYRLLWWAEFYLRTEREDMARSMVKKSVWAARRL